MGWVSQATDKVSESIGTAGSGSSTLGINLDDLSKTLTTDSSKSGIGALGKELTNNELVNAAAVIAGSYFGGPLGAAGVNGLISRAQGHDWNQVVSNAAAAGLLSYGAGQMGAPSYDWSSAAAPVTEVAAESAALPTVETVAPQYSANQAIASGMSPGSMGAQMAAPNWAATAEGLTSGVPGLTEAQTAAGYGAVTKSALPGLYEMAQVGNAAALTNQLANAGSAANIARMLGMGGGGSNLSQTAINILQSKDQGTNPGGLLTPSLVSTGPVQQESSILKSLPQLTFGHAPTVAALSNSAAPQGYKRGGLAHHQPEFITGATGHYVKGKGDGQSDDIPAMLADGEYVFDADTVAALGNGSSDAGAQRLDEMRKAIRKHKRSAPVDKIPPKAKSPLEYLKG